MLSDKRILEQLEEGNIIISPFNEGNLGTNSYDCTLGNLFYKEQSAVKDVFMDDPGDLCAFWGCPLKAVWSARHCGFYIPVDPGEMILAHTQEIIGARNGYVPQMFARSTTRRCGLSVCSCAGLGDIGYIAQWTLELHNTTMATIWIPVGTPICQFTFHETGETFKEYCGHYGRSEEWSPEDMLPKAIRREIDAA